MLKLALTVLLLTSSCASPVGSHALPSDLPTPSPDFWEQIGDVGNKAAWDCGRCEEPTADARVLFGPGATICHNCTPRNYEAVVDFTLDCINTDRENDAIADRETDVLAD